MRLRLSGKWTALAREMEPVPTITSWLRHDGLGPRVYIAESLFAFVCAHLEHDTSREHGGFLLGKVVRPEDDDQTTESVVRECVACPMASGSLHHLTLGPECWQKVYAYENASDGQLMIVGWFHSHPGMPLRPSARDEFIQRHFFAEPWQLAWICDPLAGTHEFYTMQDGSITAITNVGIERSPHHE